MLEIKFPFQRAQLCEISTTGIFLQYLIFRILKPPGSKGLRLKRNLMRFSCSGPSTLSNYKRFIFISVILIFAGTKGLRNFRLHLYSTYVGYFLSITLSLKYRPLAEISPFNLLNPLCLKYPHFFNITLRIKNRSMAKRSPLTWNIPFRPKYRPLDQKSS